MSAAALVPAAEARSVVALDEARAAIAVARQTGDAGALREWRDRAAAVQHYARMRDDGRHAANEAGEIKVRAERALGQLDAEGRQHGGSRKQDGGAPILTVEGHTRAAWRKLGALDEPEFEALVERAREDQNAGVSTASLVRLVRAAAVAPPPVTLAPLPEGAFRVIAADPPWQYDNKATRGAAEDHYSTMTIEELCALDVIDRAADDAHLYLWTTNGFLRESFDVLDAWGFSYKTCLTWVKPQMGLGNYFRSSTEHVLFGVRGKLATADRALMNWFQAPRGRHSKKPDSFYDLVERASPGPYLELFARRRRFGWEHWGVEA